MIKTRRPPEDKDWWKNCVEILGHKEYTPNHIPELTIMQNMPKYLVDTWEDYMRGKTVCKCDNGDWGVYLCDFYSFVDRYC